jgi:hypothetical protein
MTPRPRRCGARVCQHPNKKQARTVGVIAASSYFEGAYVKIATRAGSAGVSRPERRRKRCESS